MDQEGNRAEDDLKYHGPVEEKVNRFHRPNVSSPLRRKLHVLFLVCVLVISSSYLGWQFYEYMADQDDPDRTSWAFELTGIDGLQGQGLSGKGVSIGVVDTGIDMGHDELKDMKLVAWLDLVNGRSEPYDDNGHGTHVTGIMAANGKLRGGAPAAGYIICKALDASGYAEPGVLDSAVGDAIDFCVEEGADIISLSLSGAPTPPSLGSKTERATQDAVAAGVFVVCAAGNDGNSEDDDDVAAPGTVNSAISVGSIDRYFYISSFSSRGDNDGYIAQFPDPGDREDPNRKPEFVAPGDMIVSCYPGNRYVFMSGTSQAVPFVSSALALILEEHPKYRRDGASGGSEVAVQEMKDILMSTARPSPYQEIPHDEYYGYGLIDPKKVLEAL